MSVELRRVELGMFEQDLDKTDVGILLEQVRRKTVAIIPSSE